MVVSKKTKEETIRATPTGGTNGVGWEEEKSIAYLEMKIEEFKSSPKAKSKTTIEKIKNLKSILNNNYIRFSYFSLYHIREKND